LKRFCKSKYWIYLELSEIAMEIYFNLYFSKNKSSENTRIKKMSLWNVENKTKLFKEMNQNMSVVEGVNGFETT